MRTMQWLVAPECFSAELWSVAERCPPLSSPPLRLSAIRAALGIPLNSRGFKSWMNQEMEASGIRERCYTLGGATVIRGLRLKTTDL